MTTRILIAYQACLAAIALVSLRSRYLRDLEAPSRLLGLAVVAAIAERGRVQLDSKTEVSISILPTVFAAAVFGPLAGMIVSAASLIGDAPFERPSRQSMVRHAARTPAIRWGIFTCSRAIYGATAGFAAVAVAR